MPYRQKDDDPSPGHDCADEHRDDQCHSDAPDEAEGQDQTDPATAAAANLAEQEEADPANSVVVEGQADKPAEEQPDNPAAQDQEHNLLDDLHQKVCLPYPSDHILVSAEPSVAQKAIEEAEKKGERATTDDQRDRLLECA